MLWLRMPREDYRSQWDLSVRYFFRSPRSLKAYFSVDLVVDLVMETALGRLVRHQSLLLWVWSP